MARFQKGLLVSSTLLVAPWYKCLCVSRMNSTVTRFIKVDRLQLNALQKALSRFCLAEVKLPIRACMYHTFQIFFRMLADFRQLLVPNPCTVAGHHWDTYLEFVCTSTEKLHYSDSHFHALITAEADCHNSKKSSTSLLSHGVCKEVSSWSCYSCNQRIYNAGRRQRAKKVAISKGESSLWQLWYLPLTQGYHIC